MWKSHVKFVQTAGEPPPLFSGVLPPIKSFQEDDWPWQLALPPPGYLPPICHPYVMFSSHKYLSIGLFKMCDQGICGIKN